MIGLKKDWLLPQITWRAPDAKVYLTFDDGPDEKITPRLLDLLTDLEIKATFFLIGEKISQSRSISERIIRCGHTLGNHSYHHSRLLGQPAQIVRRELAMTDEIFETIIGEKSVYFRPPYGHFGINVLRVLKQTGHQLILWSASLKDYKPGTCSRRIRRRLLDVAEPGKILLLHDGHPNSAETLNALEGSLPVLKKRGLVFSALPQN
ncbi:polysaccharide deacetylase family protein [bacterium]|nr:polysaccharide deacetylase family protein [bacterium]